MSSIPTAFLCCITQEIMKEPVCDSDGNTFEREAIVRWLNEHGTSPITRTAMSVDDLVTNRALKEAINVYLQSTTISNAQTPSVILDKELPQVNLSASVCDNVISVTVQPPEGIHRIPLSLCCVIDISGSMGTAAVLKRGTQTESNGLTILDIVKHAVKTVIHSLEPQDTLSIVSFSDVAKLEFALTCMYENSKIEAENALKRLQPTASTNLWGGLKKGLEVMRNAHGVASVLLFTDGLPNVIPPRGHIPMLKKYIDDKGLNTSIWTFGFGYSLDSVLLKEIAVEGNGLYAFIPDCSFVGTVFVHAIANLLTTFASNVAIVLELECGQVEDCPHKNVEIANGIVQFDVGPLHYGQSKDLAVNVKDLIKGNAVNVIARYGLYAERKTVNCVAEVNESLREKEYHSARMAFVSVLIQGIQLMEAQRPEEASASLQKFIQNSPTFELPAMKALLEDAKGQAAEAFQFEYYPKWGKHYLLSLSRAHLLQMCNNFKDPGVQHYGSNLFKALRDKVDELFCELPPPKPSVSSFRNNNNAAISSAPVDMRAYNDSRNPCFHGECIVRMENGFKKVKDISKCDRIATGEGISTVLCVLKTACDGERAELVKLNGLWITPWHPIRHLNEWKFPCEIKPATVVNQCDFVYSFLLDRHHKVSIDGVTCITLGHGKEEGILAHPFFGTKKVVDVLKSHPSWEAGLVLCFGVKRNKTNLVEGILFER